MSDAVSTLQTYLKDARAALHDVMVGQRARRVRHGLKEVEYTMANVSSLRAYIADLEGQLANLGALATGGRAKSRRFAY